MKPFLPKKTTRQAALLLMGFLLAGRSQADLSKGIAPASAWNDIEARAKARPGPGISQEQRALNMRPQFVAYFKKYANWQAPEIPTLPPGKLRNLAETPTHPRFSLKGKDWPTSPGAASVCLWEDDKEAAYSFSIDDNEAIDVPFWKELSKKYGGLNLTWNLVAFNISGAFSPGNAGLAGTWELWQQMAADGYHLTSHSMTHVSDPVREDGWPGPEFEAVESKRLLDTNIPGQKTKLFVFPGSPIREFNMSGNWRPVISKYYASARGAGAQPVSPANQIDYFDIRSTAAPVDIDSTDPKAADYLVTNILNSDAKRPQYRFYRGWATTFIHFVNQGKDWDTSPGALNQRKIFNWVTAHRDAIWIGHLDDVALYGQERDTATLHVDESTASRITFTLTSQMDPAVFDYPLTVKVCLPTGWKSASAVQGGKAVEVQIIHHEGNSFALVKAVPDRGPTSLIPAPGR